MLTKVQWDCVHLCEDSKHLRAAIEQAFAQGAIVRRANLRDVHGKPDLISRIATAFEFPDYFGGNLDALNDCLQDMEWLPSQSGYVLVLEEGDALWLNQPTQLGNLISIWLASAEFWAAEKTPFHLVLLLPAEKHRARTRKG